MRWRVVILLALGMAVALAGSTFSAPTVPHVHFTAAGDYAMSTTSTAGVLTALAATGTDAHLALGDFSYGATGAEQPWCDFVKSRVGRKMPFELVAGNHESNGQNGNINDFSACMPNQLPGPGGHLRAAVLRRRPPANPLVRFVMISPGLAFPDGTWSYAAGTPRYNWTAAAIDDARVSTSRGSWSGCTSRACPRATTPAIPGRPSTNMLIAKKVDLVLHGHEHIYQRTKQLALGTACTDADDRDLQPRCVVDADDTLDQGCRHGLRHGRHRRYDAARRHHRRSRGRLLRSDVRRRPEPDLRLRRLRRHAATT